MKQAINRYTTSGDNSIQRLINGTKPNNVILNAGEGTESKNTIERMIAGNQNTNKKSYESKNTIDRMIS